MRSMGLAEAGLAFGLFLIILLVILGFYCRTLSNTLRLCSPTSRTMEPGKVWLLFIPIFSLVWHFFVVSHMAKSLHNEFFRRSIPVPEEEPGKKLGLAMCILALVSLVPIIGALAGLAVLVLWIMYWLRISKYAQLLRNPGSPDAVADP